MVAHVREVKVNVGRSEVDVEGRDLLAQEQKVPDGEQLRVQRRRALGDLWVEGLRATEVITEEGNDAWGGGSGKGMLRVVDGE